MEGAGVITRREHVDADEAPHAIAAVELADHTGQRRVGGKIWGVSSMLRVSARRVRLASRN